MKVVTKRALVKVTMLLQSLRISRFACVSTLRHTMRGIKSKYHNLGIYETNKISLSCFDDKINILKNGINTLAYGYKDI